jgi:hypothetical protein
MSDTVSLQDCRDADNRPCSPGTPEQGDGAHPYVDVAVRIGDYWDSPSSWRGSRFGHGVEDEQPGGPETVGSDPADGSVIEPGIVDATSAEFATVWQPVVGPYREPRPGLLMSVVRAGGVIAYPPPLFERPAGPDRTLVASIGEGAVAPAPAVPEAARRPADETATQKAGEVRALVGALVDVLAGRRPAGQVAAWVHASVRETLRSPGRVRYGRAATLRRVRLAAVGGGVEAMALVQDGSRMRAVAFRFDSVAATESQSGRGVRSPRWMCTALQAA